MTSKKKISGIFIHRLWNDQNRNRIRRKRTSTPLWNYSTAYFICIQHAQHRSLGTLRLQEERHPQGGYSGFQVTGMIEGFFGVEVFDSRIFFG